jgi:hypothetical protein
MSCHVLSCRVKVPFLRNLAHGAALRDAEGPATPQKKLKKKKKKVTSPRDAGATASRRLQPVAAQAGPQHWHLAWFAWFSWPLLITRAWLGLGGPLRARPAAVPRPLVGCVERGAGPFTSTDVPGLPLGPVRLGPACDCLLLLLLLLLPPLLPLPSLVCLSKSLSPAFIKRGLPCREQTENGRHEANQ